MENFPFIYNGKEYWYSRSVACITILETCDDNGEIYVLAIKRGKGASSHQGQWCIPGGYLDHNETCEQAALRELFEETGIDLRDKHDHLPYKVLSNPTFSRKQDVVFVGELFIENLLNEKISTEFSEPDEVEEIKWIPIKDLENYDWAFSYKYYMFNLIQQLASYVEPSI